MRKLRVWAGLAVVLATAILAGCGGHGSGSTANVRLVNATLTHASLDLLANSSTAVSGTAQNTVSGYSGVGTGQTLQINDSTTGTVLATTAPTLVSGQHYAVIAYESGGTLRTTLIQEDTTAPASGTANLRIFNTATDAGAIDVYVTTPGTDLSTISTPTFSFASSSSTQATGFLSLATAATSGTAYEIRVTGVGNKADMRLDLTSFTLTSGQNATVLLTPTVGGTLANGSVLVEQSTYAAFANNNVRIRLVAAVTAGASVTASAGTTVIGSGVVSPAVGAYTLAPAGAALNITVGGNSVAAPALPLAAGSDLTLLVYGPAAGATASLIADDNHLPTVAGNFKIRLLNGITGAATPLTLDANFGVVASNVAPGTGSPYAVVGASLATRLDVISPSSPTPLYTESNLNVPGNAVYTLFMLGDAGAPIHLLQRDH
ncbi:MAG: DUF4397 domain-containing protein [Caldimonas sp.]